MGVVLSMPGGDRSTLYFDAVAEPQGDRFTITASLLEAGQEAARARGWVQTFTSVANDEAEFYQAAVK